MRQRQKRRMSDCRGSVSFKEAPPQLVQEHRLVWWCLIMQSNILPTVQFWTYLIFSAINYYRICLSKSF